MTVDAGTAPADARVPTGASGLSAVSSRAPVPVRLRVAVAVVLIGLAAIVLWPAPIDGTRAERVRPLLDLLEAAGIPSWLTYGTLEFAANVVLFVPVGFVLSRVLGGAWFWAAPALGAGLSAAAEAAQLLIVVQRTPDPRDLVSNTLGFTIGWLAVLLARRRGQLARRRGQGRPIPR